MVDVYMHMSKTKIEWDSCHEDMIPTITDVHTCVYHTTMLKVVFFRFPNSLSSACPSKTNHT